MIRRESDWVAQNREKLLEQYSNRYIAVIGEEVVASGVSVDAVLAEASRLHSEPPFIILLSTLANSNTLLIL